ncbi:histidine kinase [Agromyces sp. H3Y2-19a]|uniref:sensor histidine kinase n=1 Tax=Agromyces chromiiresistens TaxID=3030835 RepID=UPI0023B9BBBB|nr:histidine kinase [Agromyces chromiiresistens]MDF0513547.1 histidine kinase [Agromyces chromiiresistens]
MASDWSAPPLARSLGAALTLMMVLGVLFAALEFALLLPIPPEFWVIALFPAVALVWFVAGTIAWRRRPSSRTGLLIWVGGISLLAGGLLNTGIQFGIVVGSVFATVIVAVIVHLLLAFPSGRLPDRTSRAIALAGYFVALVLQTPVYVWGMGLFAPAIPANAGLATIGGEVQRWAGLVVVVATAVVLGMRLRATSPGRRRVLVPLYGYGMASVVLIPASASLDVALPVPAVVAVQLALIAGVAVAFTVGVLVGGFERTAELEELAAWLGTESGREPLRSAIARALGDPSVELVYWLPVREGFVDEQGIGVDPPDDPGRGFAVIESDGAPVGAIVYDARLVGDQQRVQAVGRVAAIAIARERLTTELRASQTALRHSRVRLVEAADRERARIAKDLHDGLQVQLVLLALEAGRIHDDAQVEAVRDRALHLRQGIEEAADELRRLVHEVMPSALVERGLVLAAEDLVDRMPIPTTLRAEGLDAPLSPTVLNVAYFVVAEGLANTVKHARAASASVSLTREGDVLAVEIADDGVGGTGVHRGRGLAGLADRIDAVGGRMSLRNVPGGGTSLRAELPCGS